MSTRLANLNSKHEFTDSDTLIPTLRRWRDAGIPAEWAWGATREDFDPPVKTAFDFIKSLVQGSPRLRVIFQQLADQKVMRPLDKKRYGHHQKVLIVDSVPINAWYIEKVLRAALVDAKTLHSSLDQHERDVLVKQFNDPKSDLKVLITTYDVGSVGLNLHKACNCVILTAPGRSWSQEAQAAGRALRVCQMSFLSTPSMALDPQLYRIFQIHIDIAVY